jgi:hypothetical protein
VIVWRVNRPFCESGACSPWLTRALPSFEIVIDQIPQANSGADQIITFWRSYHRPRRLKQVPFADFAIDVRRLNYELSAEVDYDSTVMLGRDAPLISKIENLASVFKECVGRGERVPGASKQSELSFPSKIHFYQMGGWAFLEKFDDCHSTFPFVPGSNAPKT